MPTLEAQLTALTQEFVAKLVDALRNASFAEVAALSPRVAGGVAASAPRGPRTKATGAVAPAEPARARAGGRQTAARRAEIGERVLNTLKESNAPMGVRALASELGVPADLLAAPLRELRAAGRVKKHGEKRSTTYSVA